MSFSRCLGKGGFLWLLLRRSGATLRYGTLAQATLPSPNLAGMRLANESKPWLSALLFDASLVNGDRNLLENETASTANAMALRELSSTFYRLSARDARPATTSISRNCRRYASGETSTESSQRREEFSEDLQELESSSSYSPTDIPAEKIKAFDPVKRAQGRKRQLPPSRYVTCKLDFSEDANTYNLQIPI